MWQNVDRCSWNTLLFWMWYCNWSNCSDVTRMLLIITVFLTHYIGVHNIRLKRAFLKIIPLQYTTSRNCKLTKQFILFSSVCISLTPCQQSPSLIVNSQPADQWFPRFLRNTVLLYFIQVRSPINNLWSFLKWPKGLKLL